MNYNRVFKQPENLESMIRLRKAGYTYKSLAFIFGVDHSSIYHHCKNIIPSHKLVFELANILGVFQVDTSDILILLNIGTKREKTYADYLSESKIRSHEDRMRYLLR